MFKQLREIRRLLEKGDYQDALGICDQILSIDPSNDEVLREKSSALLGLKRAEEAVRILSELSARTNEPSDYFDLARACLKMSCYSDAIIALDALVEVSKQEGFDYYLSSALFLRAFALVEVGELGRARNDIARIPDDMKFWVPGRGLIDKGALQSRI